MPIRFSPYHFFLSFACFLLPVLSYAQSNNWDVDAAKNNKKAKVAKKISQVKKLRDHIKQWGLEQDYSKGILAGGRLNSNGWSGGVYYFTKIKPGSYNVWQLHFSEIKHEKQIKQENIGVLSAAYGETTPYIFGKINNLYTLNIGYARQQLLLPNVIDGNLSVSFRYGGGFSLALLKPYYLRLVKTDYSQPEPVSELIETKYTDSVAALFLERNRILGASKWSKGLCETKLVPGAYLEAAFIIEPAQNKTFVQAISLGVNGSIYTRSLPILAELKAYPWQVSLFAGLAIGKRWK